MHWTTYEIESTSGNIKFGIYEEQKPINHRQFLELLGSSQPFRTFYNSVLAESGYPAFFWENKPLTTQNLEENYECNVIDSPFLSGKTADTQTFNQYFSDQKQVVTFPNLGRDARLIAPCPRPDTPGYPHIGTFVRKAPKDQIDKFWCVTAEQMQQHISHEPRWLSTSGLGVFWLHARIDFRPKYYQTDEYKRL